MTSLFAGFGLAAKREIEPHLQRSGVERVGGLVGPAHMQRAFFEHEHQRIRCGRDQRGFGVSRVRADARGLPHRLPAFEGRTSDDRDGHGARRRIAMADGEVQVFEIGGEVLFERERHCLRDAGRSADRRQVGTGECDIGGRQDHHSTAALGQGERVGDRAALYVAGTGAVGVDDQPGRWRVLGRPETDHQGFSHTVIRLRNCAGQAAPFRHHCARGDCTG